ncbi:MAG: dienelactone hydrolase family protein [Chloroflexi bacterium]|nr:dienelactone hydrolase family protein [Chloroflexota bacterium]
MKEKLWSMLGDLPPLFTPDISIIRTIRREGFTIEHFRFDNGAEATVYGYVLVPEKLDGPVPGILYNHFHGGKYFIGKDELFLDHITEPAFGVQLVKLGYVVLCIDAYGFGERQTQGPVGEREAGQQTELSLFKKFLWEGKTLWGMIVRDDLLALNVLLSRPDVNPSAIITMGMSLGGSRSTWLAALDERITHCVPIAQMTRYQDFDAAGNYVLHGIYYYVPGMLAVDMGDIVASIAPRHQLILIGDSDPLSPIEGVRKVIDIATQAYADCPDHFQAIIYEGVGHAFTDEMRNDIRRWLASQVFALR